MLADAWKLVYKTSLTFSYQVQCLYKNTNASKMVLVEIIQKKIYEMQKLNFVPYNHVNKPYL